MNDRTDEDGQPARRGVFEVDDDKAFDALTFAWGDQYDELWHDASGWGARHKDGGEVTAAGADELNRALRADWARRAIRLPGPGVEELREVFFSEHGGTR